MTDRKNLIPKYEEYFQLNGKEFGIEPKSNKIANIIETEPPNLAGEHLGSVCKLQTVQFENGDKVELFVKQMPTNAAHMEQLKEFNIFARESNFFNVLLKDLQEIWLERSRTGEKLDFFPKCLHADDKEIILENVVKGKGYQMNSKLERQNLEYAKMTVENLATFQAVGYTLLNEIGEADVLSKYPCLKEIAYTPENLQLAGMLANTKIIALEIINNFKVPGGDTALKTLEKYGTDVSSKIVALVSPESQHVFRTIGHGDFWNNNMLFLKDPTTGQLKHQVLIDFQVTRIASPNLDLGYYLFTSVQPEIRRANWKQILETYFTKFQATIKLLTKEQAKFTFEEFVADFKVKSLLGFWIGILFATLIEVMATIDMSEMKGDFAEFFHNAIMKWMENNKEKSEEKAKELVQFCEDYESILIS